MDDDEIFTTYGDEALTEEEIKEEQESKLDQELMDEDHKRLASKFPFDNGNGDGNGKAKEEEKDKATKADLALETAKNSVKKLFVDEYQNPHAYHISNKIQIRTKC